MKRISKDKLRKKKIIAWISSDPFLLDKASSNEGGQA